MSHLRKSNKYDITVSTVPLLVIIGIIICILVSPERSSQLISSARDFLGNQMSTYYLLLGIVFICISMYLAFSKHGNIVLGDRSKPRFSTMQWSMMIFTSTMAADILFYSLHEWMYYWTSTPLDFNEMSLENKILWSESYSLFHWGLTPWIFYILPAVAYAYMMHVKKRDKQKVSEACRPLFGDKIDGPLGKIIDIVSVLALLIATSTTFSLATPLLSSAICAIFHIQSSKLLTIVVLLIIAAIYTAAVLSGFKGISKVSTICVVLFCTLAGIFLVCGDTRFIVENALNSLGNTTQNFIRMSTWTDVTRTGSGFPQDWTVFYWAYWIAWSVANPFFIAKISEGRTIRNTIIGGTASGLAGSLFSFMVFGGFGIAEQASGRIQVAEKLAAGADASDVIIEIFNQLSVPSLALFVLVLAMIGFYTSTFDALTHVVASYSYKKIGTDEEPSKLSKVYWSVLFILLPVTLLFSESTMTQLQSLSIIAAFPFSILVILVVVSFFKELRSHYDKH